MENILKQFESRIRLDKKYGQILMQIDSHCTIEKAIEIIEKEEFQIFESKWLSSDVILFKLSNKNIQKVILKLLENGFTNIGGYNAPSNKLEGIKSIIDF